ncbi:MAG: NUDIX domain-containing protein [Acidimicrobiia bacterium]
MPETTIRHAARVLLIDDQDRVLLFRYGPSHKGRYFWVSPGGGLEAGETHRCPTLELDAAHLEGLRPEGIVQARWWTLPDLRSTEEFLVPRHLADLVAEVLAGNIPTQVTRLEP